MHSKFHRYAFKHLYDPKFALGASSHDLHFNLSPLICFSQSDIGHRNNFKGGFRISFLDPSISLFQYHQLPRAVKEKLVSARILLKVITHWPLIWLRLCLLFQA